MILEYSVQRITHEIIELLIWSNGFINISEAHQMTFDEFHYLRKIFKEKFEQEQKNKQEFIKNTFEFAKKGIEIICKTIAGAFGGKK
jgi:enolase